jgi:prevent-host-death family protein
MYKKYEITELYKRWYVMLSKISAADARKKFANIINRVAYGKESFVLTRRGEPLAAIVSIEDLRLLQEIEEQLDIEDAWKARKEPGENISWETLREELEL